MAFSIAEQDSVIQLLLGWNYLENLEKMSYIAKGKLYQFEPTICCQWYHRAKLNKRNVFSQWMYSALCLVTLFQESIDPLNPLVLGHGMLRFQRREIE